MVDWDVVWLWDGSELFCSELVVEGVLSMLQNHVVNVVTSVFAPDWVNFLVATKILILKVRMGQLLIVDLVVIVDLFSHNFSTRQLIQPIPMCHTFILSIATALFNINESKCILDQSAFDHFVNSSIIVETRSLIDFKQPRLQAAIQQNVKAQNLKALVNVLLAGFGHARFIVMLQMRLTNQNGFDYHVFDILAKFRDGLLSFFCFDDLQGFNEALFEITFVAFEL